MAAIPADLRYTKDHEYVKTTGDPSVVQVGITDYAQGELGDVVYVDLPKAGATFKQGATFGTIEAVKAVSELSSRGVSGSKRRYPHAAAPEQFLFEHQQPFAVAERDAREYLQLAHRDDQRDAGQVAQQVVVGHAHDLSFVPDLIAANTARFAADRVSFACADIAADPLPSADLVLCRDCFIYLPTRLIVSALRNFRATGARYLLLTNSATGEPYRDIPVGSFRPIDFRRPPFMFPEPLLTLSENSDGSRALCLWNLQELPIGSDRAETPHTHDS